MKKFLLVTWYTIRVLIIALEGELVFYIPIYNDQQTAERLRKLCDKQEALNLKIKELASRYEQ